MPGKSLDWIREIDFEDLLDGDMKLVHEWCGIEVLISLWDNCSSINIYVSTKPLERIKRRYIKKYFNGHNVKGLCITLGVSERFLYEVIEEERSGKHPKGAINGGD